MYTHIYTLYKRLWSWIFYSLNLSSPLSSLLFLFFHSHSYLQRKEIVKAPGEQLTAYLYLLLHPPLLSLSSQKLATLLPVTTEMHRRVTGLCMVNSFNPVKPLNLPTLSHSTKKEWQRNGWVRLLETESHLWRPPCVRWKILCEKYCGSCLKLGSFLVSCCVLY